MNLHLIKNHITIIYRHLLKNKLFAGINILGLGVGLAVTFFISLFIINELSYENMHSNADRIFRLTMHFKDANYDVHWARVTREWINDLEEELPEIEHFIRFQNYDPRNFKIDENTYKIEHAFSTDGDVFEVFDFKLLRGNPEEALKAPHSVVLTESIAQRFFGNEDPMGKEIIVPANTGVEKETFKVTGIMEDLPSNTHLPVNLLTSFRSEEDRRGWAYIYLLLKQKDDAKSIATKMPDIIKKHMSAEDAPKNALPLQSIESIHLNSDLAREIIPNGKLSRVYLFGVVGLFILLMSAINFINLNSVQSLKRMREIGVRKILGSSKIHLIGYFLLEANIITLLASVLGLILVFNLLPVFNQLTPITVPIFTIIPLVIVIALIVGLAAGYYPAFVLSSTKSIQALQSKEKSPGSRWSIKNVLVAFQLILCISLISSALITRSQFEYLTNKNLGLAKEQRLAITRIPEDVKLKYEFFKEKLNQIPAVKGVTATMEVPSREIRDAGSVFVEGMAQEHNDLVMDIQIVDRDFMDVMDVQLLAGRNFKKHPKVNLQEVYQNDPFKYLTTRPREYIINETAMKMAGWKTPEEAVGKRFSWAIGDVKLEQGPVIGVVKDYHQESLRNQVEPIVMTEEPYWIGNIIINLEGTDILNSMQNIQNLWKENFPDYAMDYAFLDELYNRLYETENKQLQLIYLFSGLAVLVAFLGIYGLLSYTLKTREKEIAIRKVLGANLTSITVLLSKKFVVFTLIGMLVAVPVTWYSMNQWLQNFVYRVDINVLSFVIALVVILLVLIFTITVQMRKVALENPANILRAE